MLLIFLILVMVALLSSGVSIIKRGTDDFTYFSRERTSFINGSLILLVVLWHTGQHLSPSVGFVDDVMSHYFFPGISQCSTVAPFLFFSGIGVFTSFSAKGTRYLGTLVHHRSLQLWLRFVVIVLIYCSYAIYQGYEMTYKEFSLALLAWINFGNINWYIFIIISSYLLFALFFRIFEPRKAIIGLTLSIALMVILLKWCGHGKYWYMTPLCFPAGVCFAWKKVQLHALIIRVKHKITTGFIICATAILIFHIPECVPYSQIITGNAASVMFCAGLLIINAALDFSRPNPFLMWCGGRAVFALLLFHKLPVILLKKVPYFAEYDGCYIAGCFLLSLIGACMTLSVWEYTVDRLFVSRK